MNDILSAYVVNNGECVRLCGAAIVDADESGFDMEFNATEAAGEILRQIDGSPDGSFRMRVVTEKGASEFDAYLKSLVSFDAASGCAVFDIRQNSPAVTS